ncbi:prenyltransferase/squalene oxidase repeat-containing protein [Streptomyces caatingaensis]|uniref:Geranylgeranyl transferase type II subunit beta n=1 Tax=Streptomyces caatingaensis TaxID=1678637 RepID=A0A0K9XC71_9ACTN|nr:prenyltransferase/squalene oxidase repeat-containing protein [Streptomyces caatingaensis]KNB50247.1 prenyltransferase [Streptomyces caatingaensis]
MTAVTTAPRSPEGLGAVTGEPDLWCTYAAVRTLAWLDRTDDLAEPDLTAAYLAGRRNADGGYAWSRGMLSDAWATFYCTQALRDMGRPVTGLEATAGWLRRTWSGDAYAMLPGQGPDVWATHFSVRTAVELCGTPLHDGGRLVRWLAALQGPDGGLGWTPEDARRGNADVRACYYGVMAWRAAVRAGAAATPPWNVPALVAWLRDRQGAEGGFRFSPAAEVPCMWATYRAVGALEALGHAPRDAEACRAWTMRLRGPSGAFVRWEGYDVEDVWASFCAVGTLRALGAPLAPVADAVAARIAAFGCPQGGFTYREPRAAADALSTSAAVLKAVPGQADPGLVRWLEGCQLPNEGGVMYMPGRGSEVRCTLWALAAGAFTGDASARARIVRWLASLQNPDGGFGYWEGRGSDMVSTAAALEIVTLLGATVGEVVDAGAATAFLDSCRRPDENGLAHGNVPGATATLRAGLQAHRALRLLGRDTSGATASLLARHRVRGGGFANEGNRVPDLLSSYEAVLAADRAGLPVDTGHTAAFLARVGTPEGGTAWSPLAPGSGGPLADCLGTLLARRLDEPKAALPALALS